MGLYLLGFVCTGFGTSMLVFGIKCFLEVLK